MGVLHESLRLYAILKAMKWAHLPLAGGLYDQHPQLLDDFYIISQQEAMAEARRAERNKPKNPSMLGSGRRRGR